MNHYERTTKMPKLQQQYLTPTTLHDMGQKKTESKTRKSTPKNMPKMRNRRKNEHGNKKTGNKCKWCQGFREVGNLICSNCGNYFRENLRME